MRIDRSNIEQDGYFWVEALAADGRPARAAVPGHDSLDGMGGLLTFDLETEGYLLVGSGEIDTQGEGMYFGFTRQGEECVLPGTSTKGAVRTLAEILSPSCLCIGDSGGGCAMRDAADLCLCPACGIFGALGYRGRASFDNAVLRGGQSERLSLDQRSGGMAATGPQGSAQGVFRKLYAATDSPAQATWSDQQETVEVLRGARGSIRLGFHNLREWELGLLLLAMGVAPGREFGFKLGGGKNRGMGLVDLHLAGGEAGAGWEWFLGRRQPVDGAVASAWVDAYQVQAAHWGVWPDVERIVECLQEVYG